MLPLLFPNNRETILRDDDNDDDDEDDDDDDDDELQWKSLNCDESLLLLCEKKLRKNFVIVSASTESPKPLSGCSDA